MGVDELDKGMWERCSNLATTRGCSCYDTRPASCRKFECMWRYGLGSNRARPDKSGVMFVMTPDRYGLVAFVDARQPNAWRKGEGARVVDEYLGKGVPVFVATPKSRKALLPERSGLSASKLEAMKQQFLNDELT